MPRPARRHAQQWPEGEALAEELFVDKALPMVRLRWMHPAERAILCHIAAGQDPAA